MDLEFMRGGESEARERRAAGIAAQYGATTWMISTGRNVENDARLNLETG